MKAKEVIGQKEIWLRLKKMVDEERLPHALMLCGPTGCGKLPMALALASYLLCKDKQEDGACGQCRQCAMLRKWEHPDLHFTFPVIKPSGTSSDYKPYSDDFLKQWRQLLVKNVYFSFSDWLETLNAENQQPYISVKESEELARKFSLKSSQGGYKVAIIWLPERMRTECANKILKLLEEPPQQSAFIMVSEEPELLLDTIRSRCQRIDMKRIDDGSLAQALVGKMNIEEDDALRLARLANGNWLKALDMLNASNENNLFLEQYQTLMRLAYARDIRRMKAWSEEMGALGREKQKRFLQYMLRFTRENFMYNFRCDDLNYMTANEEAFASKFAKFINEANILEIADLIERAIRDIMQNANGKIVFFHLAVQMIILLLKK